MAGWRSWVLPVWSLLLAVLMLGPALGPGFVLTYDMVWVPDLALRPDFLGLGSALPRAVPSDAVVSVLDEVAPGMLLQKVVLLASLVGGGLGAARLLPQEGTLGRLVAVTVYQWNPFVVERLVIGHWPVLVSYAVLPWVVLGGRAWRTSGRPPAWLLVLLPLGSLSVSAGLATAVVLVAVAAERTLTRLTVLGGMVLAANAPWLVSGLLHAESATTDPDGAGIFALHAEGGVPGPVAALGLGGIWNAEVVPPSHEGVLGWVWAVVLAALALAGARTWWSRTTTREARALVGCWVVGYAAAVLTWAAPGLVAEVAAQVPGAGVVRDGSRLLLLCAPLAAVLVAHGACRVAARLAPGPAVGRAALAAGLALLPVALLPDAAIGASGRLDAVDYPAAYASARAATEEAVDEGLRGDLLVLPFSSYRQPGWNGDRKVLDPLGRHLPVDYLVNDELVVDGTTVAGEDPRGALVVDALGLAVPAERAEALAELGIALVAVDRSALGPAPDVAGRLLLDEGDLELRALADPDVAAAPTSWRAAVALAWTGYAGCLVAGVVGTALGRRRTASSREGSRRPRT